MFDFTPPFQTNERTNLKFQLIFAAGWSDCTSASREKSAAQSDLVSVAMTSDQEGSTSSYKVGGNIAGVALTLTGTDVVAAGGDASKIAASYNMGNGLTLSASVQDEDGVAEDEGKIGFSYAMDSLTVGYTAIKPGDVAGADAYGDEWDFSVKYSAGAMVASFAIDEADATTIIADYALGGGASAFAAMHDKAGTATDLTTVGLNFAF